MSFIELDKKAYFHNLKTLSQKVGGVDKLAVVLKDNAYGHGLVEMAILACEFGIKRAIVRNLDEAKKIQKYFENILILYSYNTQPNKKLSFTINSLHDISKLDKNSSIHLKIDTGMNRNGISFLEIEKAFYLISQKELKLDGVMTHFRSADEDSDDLFWQINQWQQAKKQVIKFIKKYKFKKPLFHSANSATILRVKTYEDDFARCGIATYGYTELLHDNTPLKPVLSLWGEKIGSRVLKKGERVGYGGVFKASKDMVISTYDIGYGDGFFRYDGTGCLTTANSSKILGRVSMDSMSIESDDEQICIFDDAKKLSKYFHTISYDILTKLSPSIKRIIV